MQAKMNRLERVFAKARKTPHKPKKLIRREFYPMDTATGKFDFSAEPEIIYSTGTPFTLKIED
mgnify:CR=1 FL=1